MARRRGGVARRPAGLDAPTRAQSASARNLAIADVVNAVAKEHGATATQVALAWIRAQPGANVVPIVGVRTHEQLVDNLGALDLSLADADLVGLDEASCIALGFPHDFGGVSLAYRGTGDRIGGHAHARRAKARRRRRDIGTPTC